MRPPRRRRPPATRPKSGTRTRGAKSARDAVRITFSAGLHDRRAAAVDVDRGPGHVRAGVGGEEARHVGELLGAAEAAERDLLSHRRLVLLKGNTAALRLLHMLVRVD